METETTYLVKPWHASRAYCETKKKCQEICQEIAIEGKKKTFSVKLEMPLPKNANFAFHHETNTFASWLLNFSFKVLTFIEKFQLFQI